MSLILEVTCCACSGKGQVTQEDVDKMGKTINAFLPLNDTLIGLFGTLENDLKKKNEKDIEDSYKILEIAKADVNNSCTRCSGIGLVLSEDGRTLMEFLKKHNFHRDIL